MEKTKSNANADKMTGNLSRDRSLVVLPIDGSNSLIGDDAEIVVAPGKLPLPKGHPMPVDPDLMAKTLVAQFKHWEEGVGEAHTRLYRMLGNIYEWAPLVKSQKGTEARLVALINKKQKPKNAVKTGKHGGEQLLLMLAAGFGPRANSNRNNWLNALRAAEQEGAERNATVLESWLRDVGGIKAAIALLKGTRAPAEPTAGTTAEEYAKSAWTEPLWSIPVEVPDEDTIAPSFLEPGIHVVVVNVSGDGNERTVNFLGELEPLEGGLAMTQHVKKSQERLDAMLWKLNRYALKHVDAPSMSKMSKADLTAFVETASKLIDMPAFSHRFFADGAIPPLLPEDASALTRLQVVNPTFNVYDPGRFIEGAKPGALLPYRPDHTVWKKLSAVERRDSRLIDYVNPHLTKPVDLEKYRKFLDEEVEREAERQAEHDAQEDERLDRERRQLEDTE